MLNEEAMARELTARQKQVWKLQEELGRTQFKLARLDIERDLMRQDLQRAAERIVELEERFK